jgi:ABC-type amino acid transport system permease subunit
MLLMMLTYLIISLLISTLMNIYNNGRQAEGALR